MSSTYTLSGLFIYPVKSLGGIAVPTAAVTDRGLRYDRRWMLVDADGVFLTQREHPVMAQFQPVIGAHTLHFYHKQTGAASPLCPLDDPEGTLRRVQVWDDVCTARQVLAEADAWFSEMLGRPCSLVYMPDASLRPVDPHYAAHGEVVSFSDGYPFLLIGQAALDHLNSRLDVPVPMARFRPNLVFTGGEAHDEDRWAHFDLDGLRFFPVKPCGRCQVITTDQDTGARGDEPLRTLATYRRQGHKVIFGMNLLHRGEGTLRRGSTLEQIAWR
ncbi:MAG: MOSC domain-containing protein [Bacteroidia bacterium]